jgi:hypothetical protein
MQSSALVPLMSFWVAGGLTAQAGLLVCEPFN